VRSNREGDAGQENPGHLRAVSRRRARVRPPGEPPGVLRGHGGLPGKTPRRPLRSARRRLQRLDDYRAPWGRRCPGSSRQGAHQTGGEGGQVTRRAASLEPSAIAREVTVDERLVSYQVLDGVAVLVLNHPEKRNALSRDMLACLKERLERIAADSQ